MRLTITRQMIHVRKKTLHLGFVSKRTQPYKVQLCAECNQELPHKLVRIFFDSFMFYKEKLNALLKDGLPLAFDDICTIK